MKTALRKTTNSRARRRARCHRRKDKREKAVALVPTPTLPDLYAFEEIRTPEPLIALDARQLPSIEPEPVVLPESPHRPQAAFGKTTWERLRTGGQWSFRLGLRWELPGKYPGLPWIPTIVRREARYEPDRPELPPPVVDRERLDRMVHVGLARALRELRDERYLDAPRLAEDAGIPVWQLTALEEARLNSIPFEVGYKLARALDLTLSELMRRVEEAGKEAEQ